MRELALFDEGPQGLRLLGRLRDADLIRAAAERLRARREAELRDLASAPMRLVPQAEDDGDDAA